MRAQRRGGGGRDISGEGIAPAVAAAAQAAAAAVQAAAAAAINSVSAALRKLTRISFRTLELAREGFPSEGKSHHRALHAPRRASREAREHRGGQAGRPGSTAASKRGGQGAPPIEQAKRVLLPVCAAEPLTHHAHLACPPAAGVAVQRHAAWRRMAWPSQKPACPPARLTRVQFRQA